VAARTDPSPRPQLHVSQPEILVSADQSPLSVPHRETRIEPENLLLANRRPPIVWVSTLLGPRSLNDLAYPSLDLATGTAVARAETTCYAASSRWIYEVGLGRSHCAGSAQSRQHRYARGLGHRCRGQRSSSVRPRGTSVYRVDLHPEGKELTEY